VTAVGGRDVIIKRIQMDRMKESDAREVIRWEAEQHVPFDMESVELDFQILDPLGNSWYDGTDIIRAFHNLFERISVVSGLTRQPSHYTGDTQPFDIEPAFLDIVKQYADAFTMHVNAVNPNRFLGNVSTRCMYGFPSVRAETRTARNAIYVSRRNVDKTTMSSESFVEVRPEWNGIAYFGEHKPSVDTPIQMKLYQYYSNVRYMIHGHVYIAGEDFTNKSIPCGCIEEFDEILRVFPDRYVDNAVVNLLGHGCLIMASDIEMFEQLIPWIRARACPEYQNGGIS